MLWALDRINSNPEILPGVTLGAIILDACTSKEKVVRDVTNFLTGRIPERMRKKVRLLKFAEEVFPLKCY